MTRFNRRTQITLDKIRTAEAQLAGQDNVTMRDVAQAAGVSVASVHKYGSLAQGDADAANTTAAGAKLGKGDHLMPARFPGKCKECGDKFAAGDMIVYNHEAGTAVHEDCHQAAADGDQDAPQSPQDGAQSDKAAQGDGDQQGDGDGGAQGDSQQADNGTPNGDDGQGSFNSPPPPPDGDEWATKGYVHEKDSEVIELVGAEIDAVKKDAAGLATAIEGNAKDIADNDIKIKANGDLLDGLAERVDRDLKKVNERIDDLDLGGASRDITVTIDGVTNSVDGLVHENFELALTILKATKLLWLGGPAGGGKTHMAAQLAEALDLPFHFISCTQGMLESKLEGKRWLDGDYQETPFVEWVRHGGVMLADEYDAMNDNVRLLQNAALANRILALPGHPDPSQRQIPLHEDCYFIIATNTWGNGSDGDYTGRDTIDLATRDRFAMSKVEMGYDRKLEKKLPEIAALGSFRKKGNGQPWKPESVEADQLGQVLEDIRGNIEKYHIPGQLVSTRVKVNAGRLVGAGLDAETILSVYFTGWDDRDREKAVANVAGIRE